MDAVAEELLIHYATAPVGADRAVEATAVRSFDLATEIPLRSVLFRLSADEHVWVAVVHHIAADGWSVTPLMRDLGVAYVDRPPAPVWSPLAERVVEALCSPS